MKDEYSPYKIVHHMDKIEQLRRGEQPVPLQVHIVPANVCNMNCVFCAYRLDGYLSNETFDTRDIMPKEKLFETLVSIKKLGVKAVQYTGGGEPLVHPNAYEMLKATLGLDLDMALVTNGMALTNEMCDTLGDASWVRVSLDAATPEMYSFLRKTTQDTWHTVKLNIEELVRYKRRCVIGIGYVVQKENWEDIYKAARFAKELGVDNFRISAAFTTMGYEYFSDFEEKAKELAAFTKEQLEDENFTVFNLFNDRVKDTFEGTQDYDFCPIKELQVYIGADQNVYTCCTLAYNKRGLIGSIKDQSFKDLWYSVEKDAKERVHQLLHQERPKAHQLYLGVTMTIAARLLNVIPKDAKVLDIGCGNKETSARFINRITLDAWYEVNPDYLIDLEKENLNFSENEFDEALMIDFIEHLDKSRGYDIIEQAKHVARRVWLLTPLVFSDNRRNVNNPSLWCYGNEFDLHKSLWSPKELEELGFVRMPWRPNFFWGVWTEE